MNTLGKSEQAPPQLHMGLGQPLPLCFAAAGTPVEHSELTSIGPSRGNALLKHGTHEGQRQPIMQHTNLLLYFHPRTIQAATQTHESCGNAHLGRKTDT